MSKVCTFCAEPVDAHEIADVQLWGGGDIFVCASAPEGYIGVPLEVDE